MVTTCEFFISVLIVLRCPVLIKKLIQRLIPGFSIDDRLSLVCPWTFMAQRESGQPGLRLASCTCLIN